MMPRQSSAKAVEAVGNRYDLVLIAARRVRELNKGYRPKMTVNDNKSITALTEIENGLVGNEYLMRVEGKPRRKNRLEEL
jgi:DNA-directed RNA polymerase subunit omega